MEKNKCPFCGSEHIVGISRVVGYFSKIKNWNKSKQAELKDRQKGDYKLKEGARNEEKIEPQKSN